MGYSVAQSCLTLPWTHGPISLLCPRNFSGRNTGVGCHPSPKDLPDSGTEPSSLVSSSLAGRVFTTVSPGKLYTQPFFLFVFLSRVKTLLTVLETESSRSKCLQAHVLVRVLFQVVDW